MNIRKIQESYNCILIVFLILCSTFLFSNKMLVKEKTKNNVKALDQEGQNYRLVTSADDVQVPVPKGYVASQVTGENYVTPQYQHTSIPHKGNYTELTWSSPEGEQYPWTQDENGIWISGNQGIPNSESVLESEEFDYVKGTTLTINYTYSNQYGDFINIDLINLTNDVTTRVVSYKSGNIEDSFDYTTSNYTYTMSDCGIGRYKIRAIYNKNNSGDGGQDSAYIKASTYFKEDENGETIEVDQKTRIHDGGFVIYQLTDAELETDPNGASVIINDINRETAQSTRNQYVWVPVPNVDDIVKTKEVNNGIMQFGQNYIFKNTSITKETGSAYREPRLALDDITKYYLQRYSNINKREDFLNNMQEDFVRMIKSINKYKGYYIGRYETGDDYTHNSSKKCFINPRVVRYIENLNYVTWYDSYKDLERISGKTEKYVETGMIYGNLFDYTLKWLNETDTRNYFEISSDSGTWGNYINNSITVTSGSLRPAKTGTIETISYKGETYSDSPTSSNNIFDIAGNIHEWTKSSYSASYGCIRGGDFNNNSIDNKVSISSGIVKYANRNTVGARVVLLLR